MAAPQKSVLPATWEVPAEFRSRLGEKAGRQRAMLAEGHLLLVLHAPPKKDEPDRKGRLFWRKPDGTWLSNELGGGSAALGKHLNEYAEIIDKMDRQEDVAWSVDEYYTILDAMGPIQRSARNLHATLQEARKLLSADRDLINFRDRAYDIERTAELLYGDVKNALEFAVAKKSEEQAANAHQMAVQSHRLNLLVAFFFPLATLVAIFGSEMKHGLDQYLPEPFFFYTVVGVGLVLGGLLAGWLGILNRYRKNLIPDPCFLLLPPVSAIPKIQFSLKDLFWLVSGIEAWLGLFHNLGPMGIIFTSPLLGGWFIFIGTLFRLRSLTMLGALIFFAGPLMLGIAFALFDN